MIKVIGGNTKFQGPEPIVRAEIVSVIRCFRKLMISTYGDEKGVEQFEKVIETAMLDDEELKRRSEEVEKALPGISDIAKMVKDACEELYDEDDKPSAWKMLLMPKGE